MFSYIWPIGLVVFSNILYHICEKSVPADINPFASLTATYLIAAAACFLLYHVIGSSGSLIKEFGKLNWAPIILGIVIVGLEAGWIYAYQAGWQISVGYIVQSAILAVILLLVGRLLYHEPLTWNKVLGVFICVAGLGFINFQ